MLGFKKIKKWNFEIIFRTIIIISILALLVFATIINSGHVNANSVNNSYTLVKIGTAHTWFNNKEVNRTTNIVLAAKPIDWHIMNSGDVFSFNDVVGERTSDKGYKSATIFSGNKKIQGIGGGICQLSSTLYMAVKNAKLEVIERSPHSMPVTYVKRSDEATVSYGQIDFKFKNTSGYTLQLETYLNVKEGYLEVTVWQRVPNVTKE